MGTPYFLKGVGGKFCFNYEGVQTMEVNMVYIFSKHNYIAWKQYLSNCLHILVATTYNPLSPHLSHFVDPSRTQKCGGPAQKHPPHPPLHTHPNQ